MDYQQALDAALSKKYDVNGLRRLTLDEQGNPREAISGIDPVTGFELVRRMELAYAQIRRLNEAIATHRALLTAAMKETQQ